MIPDLNKWIEKHGTQERHKLWCESIERKYGSLDNFYHIRGQKIKEATIKRHGVKGYRELQSKAGKKGGRPKNRGFNESVKQAKQNLRKE